MMEHKQRIRRFLLPLTLLIAVLTLLWPVASAQAVDDAFDSAQSIYAVLKGSEPFADSGQGFFEADQPSNSSGVLFKMVQHSEGEAVGGVGDEIRSPEANEGRIGGIGGIVTDNSDAPLTNVQAMLYQSNPAAGGWNSLSATNTDASGSYQFNNLQPGTYRVCFDDPSNTHVSECFADAPNLNSAADLVISDTPVLDVNAQLEVGGSISGYVTDNNGDPLTGVEVIARTQIMNNWEYITSTQVTNGNYSLDNLKPESYVIEFQPSENSGLSSQYFFNATDIDEAIPLPVFAALPTFGINAILNPLPVITGRITFSGTESLLRSPSIAPFIHVYGKNGSTGAWHILNSQVSTGSPIGTGSPIIYPYDATSASGGPYTAYRLGVGDRDLDFVFEYYKSSSPIDSAYTFVDADSVPSNGGATFFLDTSPGTIKGTVYNSHPTTVDGIRVHVLREEGTEWNRVGELLVGSVETGAGSWANGYYEINGLAPGKYKLFFYDPNALGTGILASGQYYHHSTPTPSTGENFDNATIIEIDASGNVVAPHDPADIDLNRPSALPVAEVTNNMGGGTVTIDPLTGLVDVKKTGDPMGDLRFETEVVCPNDLPPYDVELVVKNPVVTGSSTLVCTGQPVYDPDPTSNDYPLTFPMNQTSLGDSGIYEVTVPEVELDSIRNFVACNGNTITTETEVEWICPASPPNPDTNHSKPIGSLAFHDPSGFITDADTGEPVVGATVTLYKVPDWGPKTRHGDTTAYTCQSHNSKNPTDAWSQPAPIDQGVFSIPALGEIRPAVNPQITDEEGYYAWDVVTGCWYVNVQAEGYETLVSPVVGVPPEVTDLNLELTPLPSQGGLEITEVTPRYGLNDGPATMYIYGNGFSEPLTVTLGLTETLDVDFVMLNEDPQRIRAVVPRGMTPGVYDITVETESGRATLADAYEVLDAGTTDDLLSSTEWMWTEPIPMRVGFANSKIGLLVQHLGGTGTLNPVKVEFRLDSPVGELLGDSLTNFLAPDAIESSGPVTWEPAEPSDPEDDPKDYTVCAIIDPDNEVEETNENNNQICQTVTVYPPHCLPTDDECNKDTEPPEVDSFAIADDAQTTNQQAVTLGAAGTDYPLPPSNRHSGMNAIKHLEFEYFHGARRWAPVSVGDWIDYDTAQSNYAWELVPSYGMRYMQAWASDNAENISLKPGVDVIDLLPTVQADRVGRDGVKFYRIFLKEGQRFAATMTPESRDPDMYVWLPDSSLRHNVNSTGPETVEFEAPFDGTYQIEIHNPNSGRASYRLEFGATRMGPIDDPTAHSRSNKATPEEPAVPLDEWPEFYDVGTPPPPTTTNPDEPLKLYLPLVIR